jgi:hypothetical protein
VRGFSKYTRITIWMVSLTDGLLDLARQLEQAARVLERGVRVVDRAGTDHQHEAAILVLEDVAHRRAACGDGGRAALAQGREGMDLERRGHLGEAGNVDVLEARRTHLDSFLPGRQSAIGPQ